MDKEVQKKLDDFFFQFKQQKLKKGEILVRADENPPGIFYLIKGNVKVYCISEKGDEIILNIFKPLSFFPMSWPINKIPNVYFYEVVDDVRVYVAPPEDAVRFIKKNPDVLYDLLSRVYKGVDGMMTRMTHLMSSSAYARLIAEIIIAVKRFGIQDGHRTRVNVSEKDLALQAGLTRETVSREMRVLKQKGLVTFNKKKLEVIDMKKLAVEISVNF